MQIFGIDVKVPETYFDGMSITSPCSKNDIPAIAVSGRNIPEAWEKSVLAVGEYGCSIKTQYDKKGNPPSKDCTMMITIENPFAEPRIHRGFPAGLTELYVYEAEVVKGIHDHWICPEEGKWTYTYHKRIFGYLAKAGGNPIDQIDYIIKTLVKDPYSRRATAITWNVESDPPTNDPPCLQRIWCRILEDENGVLTLNMNTNWRSRDAYKAAFMNIFAMTSLQKYIANKIAEIIGREVRVGRHVDFSDSYHIYGSYFEEFKNFLNLISQRSFEERTWNTEFAEPFREEARQRILDEQQKEQAKERMDHPGGL